MLVVVTLFYWKNKNKYDEEEIPNEIRFGFDLSFFFFFPVVEWEDPAEKQNKNNPGQ